MIKSLLLEALLGSSVAPLCAEVGFYYLAVRRSSGGSTWELVFIDPEKSRKKGLDAYDVGTRPDEIPTLFSTPLHFQKSEDIAQKLTILLKLNEGSKTEGTQRLSWGDFELSSELQIRLP